MMRIVIECREGWAKAYLIFVVAAVAVVVIFSFIVLYPFTSKVTLVIPFAMGGLVWFRCIILTDDVRSQTRFGKEMIILDDAGLTLNGHVGLGPIPWDCVSDVKVGRQMLEKWLWVYLTDLPLLWDALGKEGRKKISTNKRAHKIFVSMKLEFCKLRGIDLVSLIRMHARGKPGLQPEEDRNV